MAIHAAKNVPQNPQNLPGSVAGMGFEYFEDDSERVEALLAELRSADVRLRIEGDRLTCDAPAGVMTADLLARLRADRDGLLAMMRRAHDAPAVDPVPADQSPSIRCPACGGIKLFDDPGGLRCQSCRALAWVATAEGGLARRDFAVVEIELIDPDLVPICPDCGRWFDVLTLADAWHCSRCDPEADERRRRSLRVADSVSRLQGRSVRGVRCRV
jgi:hypothetical protein